MKEDLTGEGESEGFQTNQPESAYALQYKDPDSLPHVVASGSGKLAEAILSLAREHGIPIHENEDLAGILQGIPRQSALPPESLGLIAEVIAFLYHCNEQWAKEHEFVEKFV